jgi:hypothetical protein
MPFTYRSGYSDYLFSSINLLNNEKLISSTVIFSIITGEAMLPIRRTQLLKDESLLKLNRYFSQYVFFEFDLNFTRSDTISAEGISVYCFG